MTSTIGKKASKIHSYLPPRSNPKEKKSKGSLNPWLFLLRFLSARVYTAWRSKRQMTCHSRWYFWLRLGMGMRRQTRQRSLCTISMTGVSNSHTWRRIYCPRNGIHKGPCTNLCLWEMWPPICHKKLFLWRPTGAMQWRIDNFSNPTRLISHLNYMSKLMSELADVWVAWNTQPATMQLYTVLYMYNSYNSYTCNSKGNIISYGFAWLILKDNLLSKYLFMYFMVNGTLNYHSCEECV